jgi:hypothetical protein
MLRDVCNLKLAADLLKSGPVVGGGHLGFG